MFLLNFLYIIFSNFLGSYDPILFFKEPVAVVFQRRIEVPSTSTSQIFVRKSNITHQAFVFSVDPMDLKKKEIKEFIESKKFLIVTCWYSSYTLLNLKKKFFKSRVFIPGSFFIRARFLYQESKIQGEIPNEMPSFDETIKNFIELGPNRRSRREKIEYIKNNQNFVFWLLENSKDLRLLSANDWQIFWQSSARVEWLNNFNQNQNQNQFN